MHKMFTLDDLYNFYLNQNKSCVFDSKESNSTIIVQVPETMNFSDEYDPQFNLLKTHLMSCHLLENLNKSSISEEVMNQAIPSFYNRPILGYIQKIEDESGNISYDFAGHEMIIGKDGDIEYEEIPVGVIPESCNPQLVYHKEYDKTYLEVDGLIYEDYTHAAEILKEKGECSVSIEISVDSLSFNAKTKIMNIEKFHFLGVTILGVTRDDSHRKIDPGMAHSNITLADFDKKNNSFFDDNLINSIADAVVLRLSNKAEFSVKNLEEGGNDLGKFEELLNKYEKTVEDITFEYENLSDEELEEAFKNAFESDQSEEDNPEGDAPSEDDETPKEPESEEEFADDDPVEPTEDETTTEDGDEHQSVSAIEDEESGASKKFSKVFEISHEDVRTALYALLQPYERDDNEWYWITAVYDDHFIYEGWGADKIFDQKYAKNGDDILFTGERVHLNRELLTDSELAELNNLRSNYSIIESELNEYKSKELHSAREEVLASEEYSVLKNDKDFKELKENMDTYSVEDLTNKADLIYAKYMKSHSTFSSNKNNSGTKVVFMTTSESDEEDKKKLPYGGLFKNFKHKNN